MQVLIIVYSLKLSVFKSYLLLHSLYYAEVCNELAGPIYVPLRQANRAPFEEMLQRWQTVCKTVFDLTGLRFEHQTSCSKDERVFLRRTNWPVLSVLSSQISWTPKKVLVVLRLILGQKLQCMMTKKKVFRTDLDLTRCPPALFSFYFKYRKSARKGI